MAENWQNWLPEDVKRAHEAITLTDWSGKIQWVNQGFVQLTGYTIEEALGQKPGTLLQGEQTDQRVIESMHRAIALGHGVSITVRNYTKGGSAYDAALGISPLMDQNGVLEHFISVGREVTGADALSTQAATAWVLSRLADLMLIYQAAIQQQSNPRGSGRAPISR